MPAAERAAQTLRLLLVEDDARTAAAVRDLLESSPAARFAIEHVTTSAAALDAIDHDNIDIVLLDLGLPDAHDLEALARLQQRIHEIPVIVLTGRDETLATSVLHTGAEDFLQKANISHDSLVRSIRYAIERHRSVRELARMKQALEDTNRHLERLTLIDPLTELLNRRGLQQALSREIEHLHRGISGTAVLVIDLDDFKSINAQVGYAAGDVVLKEIGRRIRASVRAVDYVGRLGGDEFMVILPETSHDEIVRVSEHIRLRIATSIIQTNSGTVTVTASIGTQLLTVDTPAIDELVTRAHLLLNRAKTEGKNRVVFDARAFEDTDRRTRGREDMCAHLADGRHIVSVKQPIFRLSDESPVGYEFLSRYSNVFVEMPDNFFRLCSERNVLTLVDHLCLREALRAAAALPPYVRLHLNVFPTTLLAIPVEHLLALFPKPLPKNTFCLEISEQQIIGDPSYLLGVVRALRTAGLCIAIDDVGFGSSCLESLIILEPDVIKIDKRCVIGIDADPSRIEHLRRYLAVAKSLNCGIIAEGIETASELAVVRALGIEYGQGFYWGKPS